MKVSLPSKLFPVVSAASSISLAKIFVYVYFPHGWMGGHFGGEWIRVCMAGSLHCSPETVTVLLIGYTPIIKSLN